MLLTNYTLSWGRAVKREILKAILEYVERYHENPVDSDRLILYIYRKTNKRWKITTIDKALRVYRKQRFLSKPRGAGFYYINVKNIRFYLSS